MGIIFIFDSVVQGQLRNGKITAWLLPVVLVLSLFSFSGVRASTAIKHYRPTTEQVEQVRSTNKKCAYFLSVESPTGFRNLSESVQRLHVHNLVVKIQLDQCTRQCLEFVRMSLVLSHPLQLSEEEPSISQVG